MKKKAVSLLLVAAMAATMMAGCGNNAAGNAGNSTDNGTSGDNSAAAPATETAEAGTTQQLHLMKKHGQERSKYGAHRKIRIQAGFPSSVTHLMQHIQTGM